MPRRTERTITDPGRFERELGRVQREQAAVSVGEFDLGWTCVAVPLPYEGPGRAVRALSVSLPTEQFPGRGRGLIAELSRAAGTFD